MHDIIAIGSTTLDEFWETDFETVDFDVPAGKALAIPLGEKFGTEDVHTTLGGNAANASVTFARQGFSTSLVTRIGDDVSGKQVEEWLGDEGVDISLVGRSSKDGTPKSILLLQNGERSIITYHGAINEFSLKDIDLESLDAKWWYVSLPGDSYKLFDRLLDWAWDKGIKVALNPSYKHLEGEGKKSLLRHLEKISLLVLNKGEAATLVDIPFEQEEKVFKKLDDLVPGIVAVTAGKEGVTVSDGNHRYKVGIFAEERVMDRTGAGDAFGSGFVSGLAHTDEACTDGVCDVDNIGYAIRLASANATSVIERIGATPNTLTKKAFETDKRWKSMDINVVKI